MKTVLCFDDVLMVPAYSTVSSRSDVNLKTYLGGVVEPVKLGIPLISAPMDTISGPEMCIELSKMGGLGIIHRYNNIEQQMAMVEKVYKNGQQCGVAVAATGDFEERAVSARKHGCKVVCVDIAHGDHELMEKAISKLWSNPNLKDIYIIAGNVATPEAALRLYKAGAHCVRTSTGGGSCCSTRIVTGFGIPTLQAVMDIKQSFVDKGINCDILADGGIRNSGDAAKALVAGANLVMCGGLLSGTDECPGALISDSGKKYKTFRGMASSEAISGWNPDKKVTAEGVSHKVPYRGPVSGVIEEFVGGLKSACSYAGVHNIYDLYRSVEFVRISSAGLAESHPHILGK